MCKWWHFLASIDNKQTGRITSLTPFRHKMWSIHTHPKIVLINKASKMSTSSEKYELAQDEIDSVIEKLKISIKKTEAADGEAKKRSVQVMVMVPNIKKSSLLIWFSRCVLDCLRMPTRVLTRWTEKPRELLCSSELRCWPMWGGWGRRSTVCRASSPRPGCRDHPHHHPMELREASVVHQYRTNIDNRWDIARAE